jgi:pimeloyl-ACP methyl ester carboxylesterase
VCWFLRSLMTSKYDTKSPQILLTMKRCPICHQTYSDDTMRFCRVDGTALESLDNAPTEILSKRLVNPANPAGLQTKVLNERSQPISRVRNTGDLKPETHYAKSADINIAYQVLGDGPVDLIYVPGWVSHLEYGWEEPSLARFYRRLASFSRLILFDKRGTGLSDQSTNMPTLEQRMDDVRAVMEAAHSERAVVFGMSEGGNMAMLFAATYPERTIALITFGVFAKRVYDAEYPWAPTPEERKKFYDAIEREWGGPLGVEDLAPSLAHDEHFRRWWASYQRRSASPSAALALARLNTSIDVRHVLPAIRVPTLVLHRTGDRDSHIDEGRYVASHIPNARFVELPGDDHLIFVGDQDAIFTQVENFVTNVHPTGEIDSVLATVLTITGALEKVESARNDFSALQPLAKRETEWFKGRVVKAEGAPFCATFDGPIRAVRCARAIRDASAQIDLDVRIGLHTGLCEIRTESVSGKAVEISREVAKRAQSGQILLTNTVMDLVSGSDIVVADKGTCRFEGLRSECCLYGLV